MNTMHASVAGTETLSHPPIPQEAFDWYDQYAHGIIDRRTFMGRLSTLAVAGFSMSVLLGALMPDYAHAEQVSFNDPEIKGRYVVFPSPKGHGEGRGYLVTPSALSVGSISAVCGGAPGRTCVDGIYCWPVAEE